MSSTTVLAPSPGSLKNELHFVPGDFPRVNVISLSVHIFVMRSEFALASPWKEQNQSIVSGWTSC
jgi:hypothetical protein